jgi:hypothetical protein
MDYIHDGAEEIPPILGWLADAVLPPFLVATILGLPSAILYLLELVLIIRHRRSHFSSSFFKLFAARAIAVRCNYKFKKLK